MLTFFGLAGDQKLVFHFADPFEKIKIEDGLIDSVSFGHRELKILPNFASRIWNNYIRNCRDDHSATHAFIKFNVLCNTGKDNKDVESIYIYGDYDGSVNIYSKDDFEEGNETIFLKDRKLKEPIKVLDFIGMILKEDIPVYHPTTQNCKKFSEKICIILFEENSFEHKYLKFLHRKRDLSI